MLFISDLGHNDWMLEWSFGGQLLSFERLLLTSFIEHHVLGKLAGVGEVNNIAVVSDSESSNEPLAVML